MCCDKPTIRQSVEIKKLKCTSRNIDFSGIVRFSLYEIAPELLSALLKQLLKSILP